MRLPALFSIPAPPNPVPQNDPTTAGNDRGAIHHEGVREPVTKQKSSLGVGWIKKRWRELHALSFDRPRYSRIKARFHQLSKKLDRVSIRFSNQKGEIGKKKPDTEQTLPKMAGTENSPPLLQKSGKNQEDPAPLMSTAVEGTRSVPSTLELLNNRHLRQNPYLLQPNAVGSGSRRPSAEFSRKSGNSTPSGIHRDEEGVHGYLPDPGTPYASKNYDFTDPEFVGRQQQIRKDYVEWLDVIDVAVQAMEAEECSPESIARRVVGMRNELKILSRQGMTDEEIKLLEERNIEKYGHPVGPTLEAQYQRHGSWEMVIRGAAKPDKKINWLLGLTSRSKRHQPGGTTTIGDDPDIGSSNRVFRGTSTVDREESTLPASEESPIPPNLSSTSNEQITADQDQEHSPKVIEDREQDTDK